MPRSGRTFVIVVIVLMAAYMIHVKGVGKPAPTFSLRTTTGGTVDLESYRGRPVLLVFWTTSCGICQHEMPLLNQLQAEFRDKGVSVLAIHLGSQEEADSYMAENRLNLTSVADASGEVGHKYRISGVPGLVLIDKDGNIKRQSAGWAGEAELRDWVDSVSGS